MKTRPRLCELCRRPLPTRTKKRGRPSVWHEECRQFHSAFTLLQARAEKLTLTTEVARRIKSDLFDLANTLPIVGRDYGELGRRVRNWRKKRGMLQRELAAEIGCTRGRVSRLENGQCCFAPSERRRVYKIMDVQFPEPCSSCRVRIHCREPRKGGCKHLVANSTTKPQLAAKA